MIHPTRTNLLLLKDKSRSVKNSINILKARKQALIKEFLADTLPFLRSREDIRKAYGQALVELAFAFGHEGKETMESIVIATRREFGIEVRDRSIWGLKYKDIEYHESPVRSADKRGYDELFTTPHVAEASSLFEKLLDSLLRIAEFESKLKRLGEEIMRTSRRIRVLEEMLLPQLRRQIRSIGQYISERERESYYRLKHVKSLQEKRR
jgi:V/A-type H+/Na+-transporting ATPase subunit D